MSSRSLLLPIFPLFCALMALLAWQPAAAQNRAVMQVSVTVVNTCQFGRVNSCALPGTRIVAAAPAATIQAAGAVTTQPSRQELHL